MDPYKFSLYLGFTGLAAMALLGAAHLTQGVDHIGHNAGHHTGSDGLDVSGHHSDSHAILHHGASNTSKSTSAHRTRSTRAALRDSVVRKAKSFFWSLLSPRVFFALLLGFGATGLLLPRAHVAEPTKFFLSVLGGLGFEHLMVAPLWNFVFRFASNPARTLESAVCEEARAVTNFDVGGNGLIAIDLDGQVVQVLGILSPQSRADGVRVKSGDRLFIEAVDTKRNSCTVSLLL